MTHLENGLMKTILYRNTGTDGGFGSLRVQDSPAWTGLLTSDTRKEAARVPRDSGPQRPRRELSTALRGQQGGSDEGDVDGDGREGGREAGREGGRKEVAMPVGRQNASREDLYLRLTS